eukprot:6303258-Prymnesium_polylepis.1
MHECDPSRRVRQYDRARHVLHNHAVMLRGMSVPSDPSQSHWPSLCIKLAIAPRRFELALGRLIRRPADGDGWRVVQHPRAASTKEGEHTAFLQQRYGGF